MTQYERIAQLEAVLTLRDQRRQRMSSLLKTVFAFTAALITAFLITT